MMGLWVRVSRAKARLDGLAERLQRLWRIEFFGILRCAQDDSRGFFLMTAETFFLIQQRLFPDDGKSFLLDIL
jgi:hypothetical protein